MRAFLSGLGLVAGLELRQRVRGVAWYVLLGVFVLLVAIVTGLVWLVSGGIYRGANGAGGWLYSIIVYFVLLLGTLVTPALSGTAVNGDRDAGTLATTQVTLLTTGQIVLGKFLAAWVSSLAFLVASLPFLVASVALGSVSAATIGVSALILAVELGVVSAIGVGLSGILARPLFSVVVSYLLVAALSIGTLLAFGLLGTVTTSQTTVTTIGATVSGYDKDTGRPIDPVCNPPVTHHYAVPRFDLYWGLLAANPYVVLADAVPPSFDENGQTSNLFTMISVGVRGLQQAPELTRTIDQCAELKRGSPAESSRAPTPEQIYGRHAPSWFVGLGIHLIVAAGALAWAWSRSRTPTRRLPRGSRVA